MHRRGLALLVVVTGLSACGGSTPFVPAAQPADVCGTLALADVQTVFPSAAPGVAGPSATSADEWMLECDWNDGAAGAPAGSGQQVSLIVYGALTAAGDSDLDAALARSGDGAQQSMPVSHVGEQAVYADFAGAYDVHQTLGARSGAYWVSVTAWNFPSLCAAPQLDPLVIEALGDL